MYIYNRKCKREVVIILTWCRQCITIVVPKAILIVFQITETGSRLYTNVLELCLFMMESSNSFILEKRTVLSFIVWLANLWILAADIFNWILSNSTYVEGRKCVQTTVLFVLQYSSSFFSKFAISLWEGKIFYFLRKRVTTSFTWRCCGGRRFANWAQILVNADFSSHFSDETVPRVRSSIKSMLEGW